MTQNSSYRVAIACQGGGSHTAFTAGVLKGILQRQRQENLEIVALSGTSGGAICAFLAWYGLLTGNTERSIELLEEFWSENCADTWWELLANTALLIGQSQPACLEVSPYLVPEVAREKLTTILNSLVVFDDLPGRIDDQSPELLVGAVDVLFGEFRVFRNAEVTLDALLASAAVPNIFRAVQIGDRYYWDGLFSQNPPLRDLARLKPDKLWVIQINPPTRNGEPKLLEEIRDRRNELSGNLSLQQELYFIDKINELVRKGSFPTGDYKEIMVQKVVMERDLPHSSKLDRSRRFIEEMIKYGEDKAAEMFCGARPE